MTTRVQTCEVCEERFWIMTPKRCKTVPVAPVMCAACQAKLFDRLRRNGAALPPEWVEKRPLTICSR